MIRGVIDLHAHILPGLDDGPANLDVSAELAEVAVADGTRVLAATSHVNRGFALRPDELAQARRGVVERLAMDGIALDVVQGGEIALSRLPDLDDDDLRALTLGGGRWLLLECPLSPRSPSLEPSVSYLRGRGFEVLLGHPERSPTFMRGPEALDRLVGLGALAQVTSSSFTGRFGEPVRRAAFAMLERGLVHVISSDAHHPVHRPPTLGVALEAMQRRYEADWTPEAQFEWMTVSAPGALLAGTPLPERPELPRAPRGLLKRFRA
jgi:protein-tyrosine phosphatase